MQHIGSTFGACAPKIFNELSQDVDKAMAKSFSYRLFPNNCLSLIIPIVYDMLCSLDTRTFFVRLQMFNVHGLVIALNYLTISSISFFC